MLRLPYGANTNTYTHRHIHTQTYAREDIVETREGERNGDTHTHTHITQPMTKWGPPVVWHRLPRLFSVDDVYDDRRRPDISRRSLIWADEADNACVGAY